MLVPDANFFQQYFETVDSFLTSEFTSYLCELYYSPKIISCTNCVFSGRGATNVYLTGGPVPFSFGNCPVCNGKGSKEEVVTDSIRLRIYWSRNNWIKGFKDGTKPFEYPEGTIQILGRMTEVPKIIKANKIIVNSTKQEYRKWEYKLDSEPFKHGFGNQYFVAFLSRL